MFPKQTVSHAPGGNEIQRLIKGHGNRMDVCWEENNEQK